MGFCNAGWQGGKEKVQKSAFEEDRERTNPTLANECRKGNPNARIGVLQREEKKKNKKSQPGEENRITGRTKARNLVEIT